MDNNFESFLLVFPMLLELGNSGGSVQYPFNISRAAQLPNVHVTMTIYPRLLHQVKSQL